MNVLVHWSGLGKRLKEMTASVSRLTQGAVHERLAVGPSDEAGALAQAVNQLAAQYAQAVEDGQRQRTRLEGMLKGLVPGVIAIDAQDRVQFMNPTIERWCGVQEASALGHSLMEVLRHHELAAALAAARDQRVEQLKEITLLGQGERVVEVRAAPLPGPDRGAVAVLYDVTELRRLERIRQDFVANVSHELRTPLTAIRGAVETLIEGAAKDPKNREVFLKVAQDHAERLERLVEDLLDLATVERQAAALKLETVSLKRMGERVVSLTRPAAERRRVALEHRLEDAASSVLADPFRLEQAMINLVDNAVKFTEPGGRVWLEARPTGEGVEISVHDTGIGIPEKDLPRIFERFYRVDKAHARASGGTGLGLSLAKHLIEAHGGTVRVESEEGRGTVVRVVLPKTAG